MLREISKVRQVPGEFRRRWFQDDYFDLFVWYADTRQVAGFQICYDRSGDEHALTCMNGGSPRHQRVDAPGSGLSIGPTPVLVRAGRSLPDEVVSRFLAASSELEPALREWMLCALRGANQVAPADHNPL